MSKERQESCKAAIEKVSLFVIPSLHFYVYMHTFIMYTGIRVFHYFFLVQKRLKRLKQSELYSQLKPIDLPKPKPKVIIIIIKKIMMICLSFFLLDSSSVKCQ